MYLMSIQLAKLLVLCVHDFRGAKNIHFDLYFYISDDFIGET